jgi:hypothetical protein
MASINPSASALAAQAQQTLPSAALASPYDGTTPVSGMPIAGATGMVPQLTGLSGGQPQVNATNQTAYAANGDVNQVVTNENNYTNRYYNIVVPNSGGLFSGWGGVSNLFGSWNTPGNSFIDPQTGVLYVQKETGITGWFKRLFRGY